jgi:hypothetical protein
MRSLCQRKIVAGVTGKTSAHRRRLTSRDNAAYSRHHDGHVRQRALRALLDCDEPWTAPFVVQLLGEYVIQICADIEKFTQTALPARLAMQASLSAFLMQNPCFAELTRQRAISYWSCYHRALHASRDTYPALTALSRLSGSSAA